MYKRQFSGLCEGGVGVELDEGVELPVQLRDAREAQFGELLGGDGALGERRGGLVERPGEGVRRLVGGHGGGREGCCSGKQRAAGESVMHEDLPYYCIGRDDQVCRTHRVEKSLRTPEVVEFWDGPADLSLIHI